MHVNNYCSIAVYVISSLCPNIIIIWRIRKLFESLSSTKIITHIPTTEQLTSFFSALIPIFSNVLGNGKHFDNTHISADGNLLGFLTLRLVENKNGKMYVTGRRADAFSDLDILEMNNNRVQYNLFKKPNLGGYFVQKENIQFGETILLKNICFPIGTATFPGDCFR